MAYLITFHGVTQQALDSLRGRVESFSFTPPNETEGIAHSPEADIAFRYSPDSQTLDLSIRRKPVLLSHGQLYGMIADALISLGAQPFDALSSKRP